MKNRKIVLVGCGAVGTSFFYAALNYGLAEEYVLIDVNKDLAHGNALDFEDTIAMLSKPPVLVKYGDYQDCADADIIVITAGVAQKPGEPRTKLIESNAKIMKSIALSVKNSGFKGITIIASNPVDIVGAIYQKFTGFAASKVIPSGTILDSARLRFELATILKVSPQVIDAYVVGEHGDSSVSVFSSATVGGVALSKFKKLTSTQLKKIHEDVFRKAYKIIDAKRATYYGIGVSLLRICRAVLFDENTILPVSVVKQGSLGIYAGWPVVVNKSGWKDPLKLSLSKDEETRYKKSCSILKEIYDKVLPSLK